MSVVVALMVSAGVVLFMVGFVYIFSSRSITNHRRAMYRLSQSIVWCFVFGMILLGNTRGMWVMIAWSLIIGVAYHVLFKYRRSGSGLERGVTTPAGTTYVRPSPVTRVSNATLLRRAHDDLERTTLTPNEERILEEIKQGLLESS